MNFYEHDFMSISTNVGMSSIFLNMAHVYQSMYTKSKSYIYRYLYSMHMRYESPNIPNETQHEFFLMQPESPRYRVLEPMAGCSSLLILPKTSWWIITIPDIPVKVYEHG
jgi:hypothetical protein